MSTTDMDRAAAAGVAEYRTLVFDQRTGEPFYPDGRPYYPKREPILTPVERLLCAGDDEPPWVMEYNASYTWEELLVGDGWQLHHVDRDGTHHWVRPGKSHQDGSSATTGHNGKDKLHVFSSSIDWLPCDDSYSRWAYMVHRDFGGDFRRASRKFRRGVGR